jgi:hypothetical protein
MAGGAQPAAIGNAALFQNGDIGSLGREHSIATKLRDTNTARASKDHSLGKFSTNGFDDGITCARNDYQFERDRIILSAQGCKAGKKVRFLET